MRVLMTLKSAEISGKTSSTQGGRSAFVRITEGRPGHEPINSLRERRSEREEVQATRHCLHVVLKVSLKGNAALPWNKVILAQ